jgi:hypothetical protein
LYFTLLSASSCVTLLPDGIATYFGVHVIYRRF